MKSSLIFTLLALLLAAPRAQAHGGEDHGAAKPSTAAGVTSFSTHALSESFELLLRYEPLEAGKPAHLRLFLSDYASNAPVPAAKIILTNPEDAALKWTVKPLEPGVYEVEGQFPVNKKYSFAANIVAGGKADLMLLEGIEVGKKLPITAAPTLAAPGFFSSWKNVLLFVGAFVAGIALTALLMRRRAAAAPLTSNASAQ